MTQPGKRLGKELFKQREWHLQSLYHRKILGIYEKHKEGQSVGAPQEAEWRLMTLEIGKRLDFLLCASGKSWKEITV